MSFQDKLGPLIRQLQGALGGNRIVRGIVDATSGTPAIVAGEGFTITDLGVGNYRINFTTAFGGVPSVALTAHKDSAAADRVVAKLHRPGTVSASVAELITYRTDTGALLDASFHFIAVGPL